MLILFWCAQEKGSATITSLTSPLHLAFGPRRRPLLSQEEEETEEGALVAFARANEANVAFMQSLHKRVATRGVLCNSVNPGLVTGNVIAPLSSGGDDFELGLSLLGGWGGVDALLKLLVNKFWPRIFPSLWRRLAWLSQRREAMYEEGEYLVVSSFHWAGKLRCRGGSSILLSSMPSGKFPLLI